MSMLNLCFCGRIRSPCLCTACKNSMSATTTSHFSVFRFPERLNQGYSLVNRVFSSDDDQRLGNLICAGSGVSQLKNRGTDFLTVREPMPLCGLLGHWNLIPQSFSHLPCDLVFWLQGVLLHSPNRILFRLKTTSFCLPTPSLLSICMR